LRARTNPGVVIGFDVDEWYMSAAGL
jgi:hypothetical protein